jgi:hypothetical protein
VFLLYIIDVTYLPLGHQIRDVSMFWAWARNQFVKEVYNVTWYNSQPFGGAEGFISNRDMFLVGMPRLRQIRIKAGKQTNKKSVIPFFSSKLANFYECNCRIFTEQDEYL